MKPVRFHSEAEAEMNAAAAYYENEQNDLGKRFLASVQEAISKIQINPLLYPVVDLGVRRCLTRTFPFGVLYRDHPGLIEIVAVMHLHREPGYWKSR
ncbi:MAG: type II toxin-antitoxin system RelE/ParE family toxin [Deltaproteobacteria bacterium]|nr:type II toxin-antitoxin system RelE/ParE family toxin [Deltaproteobacteria bacterium]